MKKKMTIDADRREQVAKPAEKNAETRPSCKRAWRYLDPFTGRWVEVGGVGDCPHCADS